MSTSYSTLENIERETGAVPQTRFKDALAVQNFARRLIDNDQTAGRAFKRARCNGQVDGNPPYRNSALIKAGRAEACNVNWQVAKAFVDSATGPFYDLFSEAPGYMEVTTAHGTEEERAEWSRGCSEEANQLLEDSQAFDRLMQQSQWEMVMHGCGPLFFEDRECVLPRSVHCGDLKVPEFTPSDLDEWEVAAIQVPYFPPDLYKFIAKEDHASAIGWNIAFTKNVIANAINIRQQNGMLYDWEFYQQELKNNSYSYVDDSKVCWVMHVFWKEFDGTITHAIVQRDSAISGTDLPTDYLFLHQNRYRNFRECVHSMYFDRGNGGYHHSVTGLGVKMYAGMEFQNRLLCKMADDAFLPKTMFSPMTPSNTQKFELMQLGPYAVLPAGFQMQQAAVQGVINDEVALENKLSDIMESNLSAYRQQLMKQEGNPPTARQVMYDASQQSSLSKTTVNRYYKQLDALYKEIYRRMSDLNSTDPMACAFRDACERRHIPPEAYANVIRVRAIRVIGQGNSFMRQQAAQTAWTIYGPALPEEGRSRLLSDGLASSMGYLSAARYNPSRKISSLADDQRAEAMLQVAAMKVGVPPVVTQTQNPVTYAMTFLQAAAGAMQSVQQGANPMEVVQFLKLAGTAIMAHMQRFGKDPAHQQILKQLVQQWKQIAQFTDQLEKQLQQQADQQQQQQTRTATAMGDIEIKRAKAQADIQIKTAKTQAQLQQSREKHMQRMAEQRQGMVLEDAKTAADIHRNRLKSIQE